MSAQTKSPRTLERPRAQIEATYRGTSPMSMNKASRTVNPSRQITTQDLEYLHDMLGVVNAGLEASQGMFDLIGAHTTDGLTVTPMAESGKTILAGTAAELLSALAFVGRALAARQLEAA